MSQRRRSGASEGGIARIRAKIELTLDRTPRSARGIAGSSSDSSESDHRAGFRVRGTHNNSAPGAGPDVGRPRPAAGGWPRGSGQRSASSVASLIVTARSRRCCPAARTPTPVRSRSTLSRFGIRDRCTRPAADSSPARIPRPSLHAPNPVDADPRSGTASASLQAPAEAFEPATPPASATFRSSMRPWFLTWSTRSLIDVCSLV